MLTHRPIRRIVAIVAIPFVALLIASCDPEAGSTAPAPTAPTATPEAARTDPAAPDTGALAANQRTAAVEPRTVKSSFWDDELAEAIRKRRAHNAQIEALVRFHGMPEEDIERLMATKDRYLAEEIAWFHHMRKKYPF